jgi:hypothetical protein
MRMGKKTMPPATGAPADGIVDARPMSGPYQYLASSLGG